MPRKPAPAELRYRVAIGERHPRDPGFALASQADRFIRKAKKSTTTRPIFRYLADEKAVELAREMIDFLPDARAEILAARYGLASPERLRRFLWSEAAKGPDHVIQILKANT